MKIALVGSFNLADGYLGAAKALERLNYKVEFVPAQLYKSEHPESHVAMVMADLVKINPDIVLWWRAETMSHVDFKLMRSKVNGKFIMYSWDDPFQWECHKEMPQKCKILDVAFSCCEDSVKNYIANGCKKAVYCPPGFDPSIHYPEEDENYKCDISIVCTNLYDDDIHKLTIFPHLSRKKLLDLIIEKVPEVDLRIYGSENFSNYYGDQYKGWINFNESRKVFHNSKISLCTHIRPDGDKYINERVTQVLGSKGLLLVDHVKGIDSILKPNDECVVIDFSSEENFVNQIKDMMSWSDEKINKIK